mmetsp:Transcript_42212/g.106312  ORF Transcript_42212/g.106312 Transcript_42212/m.106312 type:complete len:231 (-) Transcript_42212:101-793(-)
MFVHQFVDRCEVRTTLTRELTDGLAGFLHALLQTVKRFGMLTRDLQNRCHIPLQTHNVSTHDAEAVRNVLPQELQLTLHARFHSCEDILPRRVQPPLLEASRTLAFLGFFHLSHIVRVAPQSSRWIGWRRFAKFCTRIHVWWYQCHLIGGYRCRRGPWMSKRWPSAPLRHSARGYWWRRDPGWPPAPGRHGPLPGCAKDLLPFETRQGFQVATRHIPSDQGHASRATKGN